MDTIVMPCATNNHFMRTPLLERETSANVALDPPIMTKGERT